MLYPVLFGCLFGAALLTEEKQAVVPLEDDIEPEVDSLSDELDSLTIELDELEDLAHEGEAYGVVLALAAGAAGATAAVGAWNASKRIEKRLRVVRRRIDRLIRRIEKAKAKGKSEKISRLSSRVGEIIGLVDDVEERLDDVQASLRDRLPESVSGYGYGESTLGRIPGYVWDQGGMGLRGEPRSWRDSDPRFGAEGHPCCGGMMGTRGPTASFRYPLPRPWEAAPVGWGQAVPASTRKKY